MEAKGGIAWSVDASRDEDVCPLTKEKIVDLVASIDKICLETNVAGMDATGIMTALLYIFVKMHKYLESSDEEYKKRAYWVAGIVRVALPGMEEESVET